MASRLRELAEFYGQAAAISVTPFIRNHYRELSLLCERRLPKLQEQWRKGPDSFCGSRAGPLGARCPMTDGERELDRLDETRCCRITCFLLWDVQKRLMLAMRSEPMSQRAIDAARGDASP